ncbi:MAG: helix-turn-helix domain-containing protein [Kiritimatiellae bacterium]|nr:helix-turn-helix domain-containing protein [Kiritimatiellia bacterium]
MLRGLSQTRELSVSRIAAKAEISFPMATRHLRILGARGLLAARRDGAWVLYRMQADTTIPESVRLVDALRDILASDTEEAIHEIFRLATAFTHPRRQTIYQVLLAGDRSLADLRRQTRISLRALLRHLAKLKSRGFVVAASGLYRATTPPGTLAQLLAELAPQCAR